MIDFYYHFEKLFCMLRSNHYVKQLFFLIRDKLSTSSCTHTNPNLKTKLYYRLYIQPKIYQYHFKFTFLLGVTCA